MNIDHVVTRNFQPVNQSYDWRDCALYAVGLGVGDDPLDEDELPYVFEGRDQLVMPSMSVTLCWPSLWIAEPETGIAWTRVLHGEQRITLHRPLALDGSIRAEYRVRAIDDKGAARGALLYFDTELFDGMTGEPLVSLQATNFLRGDGGCGGFGKPPSEIPPLAADARPSASIAYRTPQQAALLYRLVSRDFMPIHADPKLARETGFDRPISHGLNTLGLACRAILKRYAPGRPDRMKSLAVRFVAPAYPGDTIRIDMSENNDTLRFQAWAVERQVMVLDRGLCTLSS